MGNVTNTVEFEQASYGPPESAGTGKRLRRFLATINLSASYATGGDTLLIPSGVGSLKGVIVMPEVKSSTDIVFWDGSTATPKLKVFAESSGTMTEVANASDQSAKTRVVELIFMQ